MNGFTELEVMAKVVELKMLRANKAELEKIEAYMRGWSTFVDCDYKINDFSIKVALFVGPGKKSEYYDITYDVLVSLYATDEDWESGFAEEIMDWDESADLYKAIGGKLNV